MTGNTQASQALRRRAEESLRLKTASQAKDQAPMSAEEIQLVLHELQVHQIEMEMQNEELRLAQVELDGARERYFDLYDLAPVGYCTVSKGGLILEANLAATSLFGLNRIELLKQPISRFILGEDQSIYYQHKNLLFETGVPQSCELRIVKPNKEIFWAHLETNAAMDKYGSPVSRIAFNDVSERKRAEEALRESEERYREIFNLAVDGILQGSADGKIIGANSQMQSWLGRPLEQLLGLHVSELFYPEELKAKPLRFDLLSLKQPFVNERNLRCSNGTSLPVEMHSKRMPDGTYQSIYRDISERKRAEKEVFFKDTVIKSSSAAMATCDLEGKMTFGNPFFQKLWGFDDPREYLGKPFTQLWSVGDEYEEIMRALRVEGVWAGELKAQRKDGTFFDVHVSTATVYDDEGDSVALTSTSVDITERKQAEEEQVKLEGQNRQLQKAESLSRMAGAIAHHFNNQLAVVMGNLEMALEDLPRDAKPVTKLTAAIQGARKAAEVSGLMLTYLGQTADMHAPLDLSETCRQSLPLLQAGIPVGLMIKIDLPSAGPTVNANTNQTQQLLTNLVTNAWEAIGDKQGTVYLAAKTVAQTDIPGVHRYPIDWQAENKAYACLEVRDTGDGISEIDIDKLFDPFYSTKFTGRGLGLPVVLGIVKACGGAVTVASTVGKGSTFRVFLPVSDDPVLRLAVSTPQFLSVGGDGTVMLVEDEEMLREMAATMLTRMGYQVLTAKDGVEALEIFKNHLDEILVVVSDLSMPRMGGWETLTALRQIRPDIPVILASGHDESRVLAGDHPELPQAFLHKPYQKSELQMAIETAMGG